MRKSMKRVVVLLLTICLLAGYAMPVLAMETGDSTQEDPGQVQVDPESTEKPAETPAATAAEGQQDPTEEPTQAPEETPAASAEKNEEEQPSAEPTQSTEPAPTEEAKEESVPQPVNYPAAPAEEQDVSGKMFVAKQGADAVYSMFKIEKATAVKVGDTIYATVFVNPTAKGVFTYSYLYFGTRTALVDQLDKGGAFDVVIGASDGEKQAYHFTLPASAAGTRVPVCVLKSDLTARNAYNSSELELIVPADIPEGKLEAVPNPVNYPAAPAEEQDVSGKMFVAKQGADAVYSMFKIEKATAVKVGDTIYATVFVNPTAKGVFTYSYLYFGTRTALVDQLDKGGAFDVAIGASDGEKQAYHFTLPASAAGTRVPVCVLKSDLTARNAYNSSELELIVPAGIPEGVQEPDPTPVASPAIPKLPDDLQEAGIQVLKVEDNAEFKMLAAAKTGMVVVGSKKLLIHFETANVSYDRLYFGAKEDTVKSPYIQGTARADGGWIFEFEVPYSYRGNKNPICLGKPDGTWYTGKDLVLSIPADGPCDTGTELSDAGIKMLAGGSDVEQSFKIDSSSAMRLGNSVYCTINGRAAGNNSAKTVDKLYLGSRDDKDKSGYVNGVVQEDGSTTFTFVVSADKQGVCIPAVVGFTTGGWDTTQSYFLNIPNFGRKFSLAYYTEGVYDLFGNAYAALQRSNNRSFPVDTDSTLTVSGDTITIKWVCRSKSYDKLYFGLLSADEATREAQAVTSSDYTPIGFGYRVYYITLSKSVLGSPIPFLRHSSSGWTETQDYLVLTDYLPRSSAAPVDPTDPDPTDPDKKISDGVYNAAAETGSAMFKVLKAVLHVKDGKYQVTLTLSGTGYDYLYAGTAAQAESADKSTWAPAKLVNCTLGGETRDFYTYTLSVEDPTNPIAVASHSQKQDKWYDRSVTLDLSSLKRTAADGKYTVTAQCDASMFKVISAKLDVINGEMMAVLTLSGTGYDYLYAGTSEEAEKDKDSWASFQPDSEGKYTYTIPVSELDKPLTVASHSQKQDKWYDRTVTFLSDSLVKVGEAEDPVKPTPAPTPTPTPTDPEKPDDESKSDNDTNGSTSKVNNSTTLKDGTYTPDGFSFSGGSGRARIICNKVTVKNGKAYATIQFVSASGSPTAYAYVKASGKIYYPTGTSTFTIPVELNKNNRILGMTTKMSAAHEIEYTIFVQLKTGENAVENPDNTGSNLSAQAPEIMGLTFKEEIQLEHAAYLKLFRYEGDIVLAEIDLTRDTVLDTDEALEALAEADELAAQEKKASASSEEESTDTAQIKADYVSALYKKDVLRYLLVPANAELPAGLEKEYLILTVPPKSLYLMDEEAEGTLEALNALELIKVLGVQTTENEVLKAGLADGSVLFGGSWDAPDYKMLVRAKTDLALASGKLLPLSDEVLAERKQEKGADREELTAVEYRNRLYELADRFAVLDIPLLIDRSADEKDALAQADWLRLYGVLLGQEKAAEEMIRKLAAQEGNV